MPTLLVRIAVSLLLRMTLGAFADDPVRPRSLDQLPLGTTRQAMRRVVGARVAYVDTAALLRDFPALKTLLPSYPREVAVESQALRKWILDNFAVMSEGQAKLEGIRTTPIPFAPGPAAVNAGRPPTYQRAAVIEAMLGHEAVGLVDLKGTGFATGEEGDLREQLHLVSSAESREAGLKVARGRPNASGVMDLAEALRETARETALRNYFAGTGSTQRTVESYFVIELPFRSLRADGTSVPAAIYGRQAHLGRRGVGEPGGRALYNAMRGEGAASLQRSASGALVDFGATYLVAPELSHFRDLDGSDSLDARRGGAVTLKGWGRDLAEDFARTGDEKALLAEMKKLTTPKFTKGSKPAHLPVDPFVATAAADRDQRRRNVEISQFSPFDWYAAVAQGLHATPATEEGIRRFRQLIRWQRDELVKLEGEQFELLLHLTPRASLAPLVEGLSRSEAVTLALSLTRATTRFFGLEDFLVRLVQRFPEDAELVGLVQRRMGAHDAIYQQPLVSPDPRLLRELVRVRASIPFVQKTPFPRIGSYLEAHPAPVDALLGMLSDADESVRQGADRTLRAIAAERSLSSHLSPAGRRRARAYAATGTIPGLAPECGDKTAGLSDQ